MLKNTCALCGSEITELNKADICLHACGKCCNKVDYCSECEIGDLVGAKL